jgi:ASC-1-like (ASCH) protein
MLSLTEIEKYREVKTTSALIELGTYYRMHTQERLYKCLCNEKSINKAHDKFYKWYDAR